MRRRLLSQRGGDYPEVYGQYPIGVMVVHEYNKPPQNLTISLKITSDELTDKDGNFITSDMMTTSSSKTSSNKCSTIYYISGNSVTNALLKKYVKGLWNADTETYPKSDSYINDAFDIYQFNRFFYTGYSASQTLYTGSGTISSTFTSGIEYSNYLYLFNFKKYSKGGKVLNGPYNNAEAEYDDSDYDNAGIYYTPFFAYQHSSSRSDDVNAIEDTYNSTDSTWDKTISADGGSVNVRIHICNKNVLISNTSSYNVTLSDSAIIATGRYMAISVNIRFPANTSTSSRTVARIKFTCDGKDYYLSFTQAGESQSYTILSGSWDNTSWMGSNSSGIVGKDNSFTDYVYNGGGSSKLWTATSYGPSNVDETGVHTGSINIRIPATESSKKWTMRIYYTFDSHLIYARREWDNWAGSYNKLGFYCGGAENDNYYGHLSGDIYLNGMWCREAMELSIGSNIALTIDDNTRYDGQEGYVTISGTNSVSIPISIGYHCSATSRGDTGITVEFDIYKEDGTWMESMTLKPNIVG